MIKTSLIAILAGTFAVADAAAETLRQDSRLDTTFGVIDLTPADNQAAAIAFGRIETTYRLQLHMMGEADSELQQTVPGTAPAQFALSHDDVTTSVVFTGTPGNIRLSGYQSDQRDIFTGAYILQDYTVIVAPHTLLTVSGKYVAGETPADTGSFDQFMYAEVDLYGGGEHHKFHATHWYGPEGVETENYWLGFANTRDEPMEVQLYARLYQEIRVADVLPVPEPATWIMLLAGLGITSIALRPGGRSAIGARWQNG